MQTGTACCGLGRNNRTGVMRHFPALNSLPERQLHGPRAVRYLSIKGKHHKQHIRLCRVFQQGEQDISL